MRVFCLVSLLLASFGSISADDTQPKKMKFKINEKEYRFSNYFEFSSEDTPVGVIVKKRFAYLHLTSHYEAYNDMGVWEATGVSRLFSLGSLFSWATEIDVKDTSNKVIGMIDGQIATLASARFSIYECDDAHNWHLKGIAFMDNEKRSFSIVDPNNDKHMLVSLKRILLLNERDHWECQVFDTDAIDLRIVKVFAAFAVDHQEYFRVDN